MFSKYVLFKKGHLNKRAGIWTPWTPPGSATVITACDCSLRTAVQSSSSAVNRPWQAMSENSEETWKSVSCNANAHLFWYISLLWLIPLQHIRSYKIMVGHCTRPFIHEFYLKLINSYNKEVNGLWCHLRLYTYTAVLARRRVIGLIVGLQ